MSKFVAVLALTYSLSLTTLAQQTTPEPRTIENGGRSVTFTNGVTSFNTGYDSPWGFSHAIRAGDFVYISGIIIGARDDDELPLTKERFREHTEREQFRNICFTEHPIGCDHASPRHRRP